MEERARAIMSRRFMPPKRTRDLFALVPELQLPQVALRALYGELRGMP